MHLHLVDWNVIFPVAMLIDVSSVTITDSCVDKSVAISVCVNYEKYDFSYTYTIFLDNPLLAILYDDDFCFVVEITKQAFTD